MPLQSRCHPTSIEQRWSILSKHRSNRSKGWNFLRIFFGCQFRAKKKVIFSPNQFPRVALGCASSPQKVDLDSQ